MHEDGGLVGTNWSGHLIGLEVRPAELQRELVQAMPPDARADFDLELARVRQEYPDRLRVLPGLP